MSEPIFRSLEYEAVRHDDEPRKLAAVIAGLGGTIGADVEPVAESLVDHGYDVIGYEYDSPFESGEPQVLTDLIVGIKNNLSPRSNDHDYLRVVGMSLGTGVGINVQRWTKNEARILEPGIYATGGTNAASTVMKHPFFYRERRAFEQRGLTSVDLWREWRVLHESPESSLAIVMAGMDYVIPYRLGMNRLREWQSTAPMKVHTEWFMGHKGAIKWLGKNISKMLEIASELPVLDNR